MRIDVNMMTTRDSKKMEALEIKQTSKSDDRLLQAASRTKQGRKYEHCSLYIAQLDDDGILVSTDKYWEKNSKVELQIDTADQSDSSQPIHFTTEVQSSSRALGKLWFYRLNFLDISAEQQRAVLDLLQPYTAPNGRQYYRHYCPNPFEISVRLEQSTQPVSDISCGGFSFSAAESYELGQTFEVKLFLDGFAVIAEVRVDRIEQRNNGFTNYGCSFLTIDPKDSGNIKDYIYRKAQGPAA